MSHQGVDPQLGDVLNRASGLQLFQLSTLIERMLGDPRRIITVRLNMHLGQTVRFVDGRNGSLREAKALAMKDTQVTLQDLTEGPEWKLPYAAIEPPAPNATPREQAASARQPPATGATKAHPQRLPLR